jgi:serine/threonine protein phosphatase PrpC
MTTLAVAEIEGRTLRTYHVGDTEILLFGSQGKLKLQTLAHSPVAYAVEAGLLDARDALAHEDRHLVNNVLGAEGMRVEMSSRIEMAPRDTLLTASDGLMDNLHVGEIVERLRRGPLDEAVAGLVSDCRHRMETPAKNRPSKADDLTLIAFRPAR